MHLFEEQLDYTPISIADLIQIPETFSYAL